jgi:hypothetical protein
VRRASHARVVGCSVALALMAGCGGVPATKAALSPLSQTSSPSIAPTNPPPSPTAVPVPTLPYVAVEAYGRQNAEPAVVRILDLSGRVVASTKLEYVDGGVAGYVVGVGSGAAYIVQPDGALSRLSMDGTDHPLGKLSIGPPDKQVEGLAESPDGAQWAYSLVTYFTTPSPDGFSATTSIFIGSAAGAPHLLATLTRPNTASDPREQYDGGYRVLRWDNSGLLLGSAPIGVGGGGPFIEEGYGLDNVVRMDPATGTLYGRVSPPGCRFADEAADGTVACITATGITVVHPDGSTAVLTVDGLNTNLHRAGSIAFVGDSSTLLYAVSTMSANPAQPGWTDTMSVAHVNGDVMSTRTVLSSPFGSVEAPNAWARVVDGDHVVLLQGSSFSTFAELLTLSTGSVRTLGGAATVCGVMHTPA